MLSSQQSTSQQSTSQQVSQSTSQLVNKLTSKPKMSWTFCENSKGQKKNNPERQIALDKALQIQSKKCSHWKGNVLGSTVNTGTYIKTVNLNINLIYRVFQKKLLIVLQPFSRLEICLGEKFYTFSNSPLRTFVNNDIFQVPS